MPRPKKAKTAIEEALTEVLGGDSPSETESPGPPQGGNLVTFPSGGESTKGTESSSNTSGIDSFLATHGVSIG
jgi:hypothetical protein